MNIAFVLLTHNPNEPAGIERSIASLAEGLRQGGHRALIVAAGPATAADDPDLLRLTTLTLPRPAVEDDLLALLADPCPVEAEVRRLLIDHRVDLVCWVDAVWGLGYLSPAPSGVRTSLMVHVLRTDAPMTTSLAHRPDTVLTVSDFMIEEAARQGLDSSSWQALPNALLHHTAPPTAAEREELRAHGPVRIVARAEPHKGTAELLKAMPAGLGRRLEIVLAAAGFEYWPGMQDQVIDECRRLAAERPDVALLAALPWQDVPPFLAGAAVVVVGSTSPETFGNVAAEALSVATPVVGYGLGHLPALTGEAGRMTDLDQGPEQLWAAVTRLLGDLDAYHAASQAGPAQVAAHSPRVVAETFLGLTRALP
ncbi:glycosyltransferase family 4 protein [Streptomyces sp. BE20]|uniref:glycosyltransferase family 4 protein n=1 Tax=Streptomyces sp. BE20 TaxID=3002525 RepID=UPI002E75DA3A|nr:glycosyltransferase family 4 protein [Streptomyces sp. BE20]MEE1823887.1 glycosyltransferase family 4 protein [Streptomyces sp. BE20]